MEEVLSIKSIKIESNRLLIFTIIIYIMIFPSCNNDDGLVIHRNCEEVETEITEIEYQIGSFTTSFSEVISLDFEEASISIGVGDWTIKHEENGDCFSFVALPQLLKGINIKSSSTVVFGGVEHIPNEELSGLFKIHNQGKTYSISEFISEQNNDPLIFHDEDDELILQLLNKPDVAINQSFTLEIKFNDSQLFNIEIPNFEVVN